MRRHVVVLLVALLVACGGLLAPGPGEASGTERDDPNGDVTVPPPGSRPDPPGVAPPVAPPAAPAATWDVQAHHAPVMDLSWSPDEAFVAVYARHEPLTVIDADSGEPIDWRSGAGWRPPGCALIGAIAWSPAGDRVAVPRVVLDTDTWSVAAELTLEPYHASDALAFSPDGALLAGGSRPSGGGGDGCVCLVVWDPATGEVVFEHDAPPASDDGRRGYIVDIAWHPDATRVAAATRAGTAVYDVASKRITLRLPPARAVAWSPEGERLALALVGSTWPPETAVDDGSVAVVDAATGEVLAQEAVHEGDALAVSWHPDGRRLVSGGSDATVAVLAPDSLAELDRFDVDGPVSVLRFGPVGTRLAVGTRGGSVHLVTELAAASSTRVPIGRGEVSSLAVSPDERLLVTAGGDSTVGVWHVGDGTLSTELQVSWAPRDVDWSPDGEWLALAPLDELLLYRTRDWSLHDDAVGADAAGWVERIAFSPDGRWLAAAAHGLVELIDPATRSVVWRFVPREEDADVRWVRAIAWSPSAEHLALAMHGGAVWVIAVDDADATVVTRTTTVIGDPAAVAWSGDGSKLVLTGSVVPRGERGTLVLDAGTLEVVLERWHACAGSNHAVGFAAADAWFWVAGTPDAWSCPEGVRGDGNALKVWNVEDGSLLFGIDRVGTIADAAFAADGSFVLIGTSLGRLMRWEVP